mgnify:CR=1 FL=1
MPPVKPLDPQALYTPCDASLLDFETTEQVQQLVDSFGQTRAHDAIRFGIDIARPGYNLYVLGKPGSGRHTAVRRLLEAKAAAEPPPGDWCYVNNFAEPNKPRLLPLPPGRGAQLRHDMQKFVADLATAIRTAFESEEYRQRLEAIQEEFKKREEEALQQLGKDSSEKGIALLRTPHGFVFAPMKGDETMDPDAFAQLSDEEKERIGKLMEVFGERLHKLLHQLPRWRREMQQRVRQANREALSLAVGHLIEELKEHYTDLLNVLSFLDEVLQDVVETGEALREEPKGEGELTTLLMSGSISLQRYQVNLVVEHRGAIKAPIVSEDNPNYQNLIGRIDYTAQLGTLVTNFTMIKGGALHRANGGYLVLDALKVLTQPFAWEGLKRALKSGQVRIESPAQLYGLSSTVPLEPEPMPLKVKVVLVGERLLYYLLREYDPEFEELFKIAADFEDDVVRSEENTRLAARLVATLTRRQELRPLDRSAVARVIEHSARRADDAQKLSAGTRWISDLLCEADHLAASAGCTVIGREQVEQALALQIRRADRVRNAIQDAVLRETLLIASSGSHVGQINGLAVIDMGDVRFAHPVRITATARLGEGDVIDIEREAELGGAIHSKGVMILSSFLAARYSPGMPLSLAASLVFEQSYGPVEGDSASLAELCALLSALSGAPIRQALAVTGSVNQYGRVQAIGGVNEKIEGFFDICKARGQLDGEGEEHGVIIPESNVKHLMLREDVVVAAREGRFHIWAVSDVDQAIELLTGVAAGEPDKEGIVPPGSINYLVAAQLAEMSMMRQQFSQGSKRRSRAKKDDGKR